MGSTLKCSSFVQCDSLGGNWIFIFNCLSIGDSIHVKDKVPVCFSFHLQNCIWWRTLKSSLCEFVCTSVQLHLDGLVSLVSFVAFGTYTFLSLGSLSSEVRDLTETSHIERNISRILTLFISGCGPLCFFPFCMGISFSDNDWSRLWSMRITE